MDRRESQVRPWVEIGLPLTVMVAASVYLGFTDSWRFAIALAIFGMAGGIIAVFLKWVVARRSGLKD